MKFELLDKWISAAKDWHIAGCLFIFVGGSVLQWFHHLDADYVGFAGVCLAAITGHAYSPALKDQDKSPMNFDVKYFVLFWRDSNMHDQYNRYRQ